MFKTHFNDLVLPSVPASGTKTHKLVQTEGVSLNYSQTFSYTDTIKYV